MRSDNEHCTGVHRSQGGVHTTRSDSKLFVTRKSVPGNVDVLTTHRRASNNKAELAASMKLLNREQLMPPQFTKIQPVKQTGGNRGSRAIDANRK
jgi:hypothetical protein